MIVKVINIDSREEAKALINKIVIWTNDKGKVTKGKVANVHGNKGALRVAFEKGMPGQSLGNNVEVE